MIIPKEKNLKQKGKKKKRIVKILISSQVIPDIPSIFLEGVLSKNVHVLCYHCIRPSDCIRLSPKHSLRIISRHYSVLCLSVISLLSRESRPSWIWDIFQEMTIMSFINRASRALHGYPASSKLLVLFTLRLVMYSFFLVFLFFTSSKKSEKTWIFKDLFSSFSSFY